MACYRPIPARQDGPGRTPVLWPELHSANMHLPCGTCIGCKTAHATQWARRCEHEASQWPHTIFLTLTYEDTHLPARGYLDYAEFTKFLKRLRKSYNSSNSSMESREGIIRYFACGEYGTQNGRPHYHALLFNCTFHDRTRVRTDKRGQDQYESRHITRLWPYGKHEFGVALPAAANYIAQYSLKKQPTRSYHLGYQNDHYYEYHRVVDNNGEEQEWGPEQLHIKRAPFVRMSRNIGRKWLEKHKTDLTHGYLDYYGRKEAIPRAYRRRLEVSDPHFAEEIAVRTANHRRTLDHEQHNDPERRAAGEVIHARRKQLMENRAL